MLSRGRACSSKHPLAGAPVLSLTSGPAARPDRPVATSRDPGGGDSQSQRSTTTRGGLWIPRALHTALTLPPSRKCATDTHNKQGNEQVNTQHKPKHTTARHRTLTTGGAPHTALYSGHVFDGRPCPGYIQHVCLTICPTIDGTMNGPTHGSSILEALVTFLTQSRSPSR